MINRLGISPAFTSKVYLVDDDYCGTYSYNMAAEGSGFDQKVLKQAIKKLENNGANDVVTLKALLQDDFDQQDKYVLQVKEMRGNTAYVGFQPSAACSVAGILKAYNEAKSDMVEAATGELADYVI